MERKPNVGPVGHQYHNAFAKRHPYVTAHGLYVNDQIPLAQAAAMAAADREFIAECEASGRMGKASVLAEATRVVRDIWSIELVANIRKRKRHAAALEAILSC